MAETNQMHLIAAWILFLSTSYLYAAGIWLKNWQFKFSVCKNLFHLVWFCFSYVQFIVTPLVEKMSATQKKWIENSTGYISMDKVIEGAPHCNLHIPIIRVYLKLW
jgi:hypothetical protein